jgi:histidine triad (HIT) family protein
MSDSGDFWGGHDSCWACHVIAGGNLGRIVLATDDVAVLINPMPSNPGHTLVVPRTHIENLYALPDALAGPILAMAARVARAAKQTFRADGVTLRQNNEPASDQHLFHFHLHVIPRFAGDGARFSAPPPLITHDEQQQIAARLRAAMS